jgi:hypothetical protein
VNEAEVDKLGASSSIVCDESESEGDGFVGKLVGFYLDSPLGQSLKQSFGKKWSDLAMCYDLNKEHGHLMGMVMRMVSLGKRKASSPLQERNPVLCNSVMVTYLKCTLTPSLL